MWNTILLLFVAIPIWISEQFSNFKLYIRYALFNEYKIFLDDERETPVGWRRAYSVEEVIEHLQTGRVTNLSLDNDLGEGLQEGYKVLDYLEEICYNNPSFPIPEITIHSANASRVQYMRKVTERILKRRSS